MDRIRYDVEKSINRSHALKKQADEKKDGVDVLDADLIFLQKDVDGVQKVHEDTRRMLDMLKRDMERLPSGTEPLSNHFIQQIYILHCSLQKLSASRTCTIFIGDLTYLIGIWNFLLLILWKLHHLSNWSS